MKSTAKLMTALALAGFASLAMAKSQDLGVLPSGGLVFSNSFTSAQSFVDTYQFGVVAANGATGGETDTYAGFFSRDVTIQSVALREFGSSTIKSIDYSPNSFTFTGLTAGTKYELVVSGTVGTGLWGTSGSYTGSISPISTSVASAAPEPAEMLLMAMGLAGVGVWVRRQKRAA